MKKYERDICQVGKEWLKGRLQECVRDEDYNIVAVCSDDADMADKIAALLNAEEKRKAPN